MTCSLKTWFRERVGDLVEQGKEGPGNADEKGRYAEEQIAFALQQAEHTPRRRIALHQRKRTLKEDLPA